MLRHPAALGALRAPRPTVLALLFALSLLPSAARAQDAIVSPAERQEIETRAREYKQIQRARLMDHFRRELAERKENAERRARAARRAKSGKPGARPGQSARPAGDDRETGAAFESGARAPRPARAVPGNAGFVVPANVRVNDPTGEAANSCQSEEAVAAWGDYVMVAWNDGGSGIGQGIGYSTDGGQTFIDTDPPAIPNGALWFSDPVVTVNARTGEFYFCALTDGPGTASSVGVVKATFSGSTLTWGTPVLARVTDGTTKAVDKQWLVADSTNGNLYLTYTLFTAFDDSIVFQRSTDGNTTWDGALSVSDPASAGLVQGSRPAVGPTGEVYLTWYEIGPIDADYLKLRRSTNQGAGFGAEVIAASFFANYGTGAPGFNRERGISFPSITVDRTTGPHRGRLLLSYNESLNFYNDPIGGGGSKTSVENDNFFSRANPFTPGQRLRGALAANDADCFSFSAVQGTSYIFYCDSVPRPLYTMRIHCASDTVTRLAFSGDLDAPAGGAGLIVWTAPSTATYYLRMAFVTGGSNGNYRIQTGIAGHGSEPGRDQRDAMIAWSDDGNTWAQGIRVNDDAARYDNWLPEVTVGADGNPYVAWYDWRDDGCGGSSHLYVSRSDDGGATWLASQRATDTPTAWTSVLTNLAPNQGDYIHITSDEGFVRPVWADGRSGNPDVYATAIDTRFEFTNCGPDTTVTAGTTTIVQFPFTAANSNPLFGNDYTYTVASTRNWPLGGAAPLSAPAAGSFGAIASITVPDTAAPGVNPVCVTLTNANGTRSATCCMNVTVVSGNVAVGDGVARFALFPSVPNPARGEARIGFSLPRAGNVQLRLYGLQGELVKTLADGAFSAGSHAVVWDGRDAHGRPMPAGAYFYRLEGLGQRATQRLVWVR